MQTALRQHTSTTFKSSSLDAIILIFIMVCVVYLCMHEQIQRNRWCVIQEHMIIQVSILFLNESQLLILDIYENKGRKLA